MCLLLFPNLNDTVPRQGTLHRPPTFRHLQHSQELLEVVLVTLCELKVCFPGVDTRENSSRCLALKDVADECLVEQLLNSVAFCKQSGARLGLVAGMKHKLCVASYIFVETWGIRWWGGSGYVGGRLLRLCSSRMSRGWTHWRSEGLQQADPISVCCATTL